MKTQNQKGNRKTKLASLFFVSAMMLLLATACGKSGDAQTPAPVPPPPVLPPPPPVCVAGQLCGGPVVQGSLITQAIGISRSLVDNNPQIMLELNILSPTVATTDPAIPYVGPINASGFLTIGPQLQSSIGCPLPPGTFPVMSTGQGQYVNKAGIQIELQVQGLNRTIIINKGVVGSIPAGTFGGPSGALFQNFLGGDLYFSPLPNGQCSYGYGGVAFNFGWFSLGI